MIHLLLLVNQKIFYFKNLLVIYEEVHLLNMYHKLKNLQEEYKFILFFIFFNFFLFFF